MADPLAARFDAVAVNVTEALTAEGDPDDATVRCTSCVADTVCVIAASVTTKGGFWWAATIAGLSMGSSQSAGRAMTGYLAPPARSAEFFGLWSFATRLASIVGPLSYGAITWATGGNQRIAILATAVFFVGGLLLLLPIRMQRGREAALAASGAAA